MSTTEPEPSRDDTSEALFSSDDIHSQFATMWTHTVSSVLNFCKPKRHYNESDDGSIGPGWLVDIFRPSGEEEYTANVSQEEDPLTTLLVGS
jgi:hypothetical protein